MSGSDVMRMSEIAMLKCVPSAAGLQALLVRFDEMMGVLLLLWVGTKYMLRYRDGGYVWLPLVSAPSFAAGHQLLRVVAWKGRPHDFPIPQRSPNSLPSRCDRRENDGS
jgi:hypothetical protein